MIKRPSSLVLAALALASATPVLAQGIGHTFFMRGSIIDADASGRVVCIGRADGAAVGQVLEVYRVAPVPGAPSKGTGINYTRRLIGHVRIDRIVNEHFAHVVVTDGTPEKHDIVELKKP
ncbi:hypothetical protein [Sphingomonas sp. DC1600-2]|uniref:hypothetical protein n=1 Tax=unclassified Sphingomonas TaxID=196159 RepID=UPI003CF3FC01